MNELEPQSQFDERRFRMNVIIETEQPGFIENEWLGRDLTLGDKARLTVTWPDPRCVMTTLAQGDLPRDTDILRALVRHNKQQVGDLGQYPCMGVYASVAVSGSLRIGDPVAFA